VWPHLLQAGAAAARWLEAGPTGAAGPTGPAGPAGLNGSLGTLVEYGDNAAAINAGLSASSFYKSNNLVQVVYTPSDYKNIDFN
jgi:hypothetical protein